MFMQPHPPFFKWVPLFIGSVWCFFFIEMAAFAKPVSCYKQVMTSHGKKIRKLDKKCMKNFLNKRRKQQARKRAQAATARKSSQRKMSARQLALSIKMIQELLASRGYIVGKPDGMMGRRTRKAMKVYAQKNQLKKADIRSILMRLMQQKMLQNQAVVTAVAQGNNTSTSEPEEADGERDDDEGEVPGEAEYEEEDPGPAEPDPQPVEETDTPPSAADVLIPKAPLVSPPVSQPQKNEDPLYAGSPQRGAFFVEQCKGCHSFKKNDGHRSGPNLFGVMGRIVGNAPRFRYSEAFKFQRSQGIKWSKDEMDCFLKDPEGCKPGTIMGFVGIKSHFIRADIIAYLKQLQ